MDLYNVEMKCYKDSLNECMTGDQFDMFSAIKTNGGNYMLISFRWVKVPGERDRDTSPSYFNLNDGSFTVKKDFYGLGSGFSMNDLLFYAAPVEMPFRTSKVYDVRNNKEMSFPDWVKEQTNGAIYVDPAEDDGHGEMTLMGTIAPSDNGNILCGFLQSPDRKKVSKLRD